MIVVKIELWPFGEETAKRELAQLRIANDTKNPRRPEYGNYDVVHIAPGRSDRARVRNHLRSDWVGTLVCRALLAIIGKDKAPELPARSIVEGATTAN